MDNKDLYMTVSELLQNYSYDDILDAVENIAKLHQAEVCMAEKITPKQLKKGQEYNASSKKKT